ncbi:MAG: cytochrome c oxidase subunit II [Bradyrhizobium sp.]|uniref:cytochrome c oxidase subunit II n=1 Tax=Bradyrhizobium sp. TaxID=376 RepID=UPI001C283128|nr:cytochrome c oxidase subunit II [Bradyrhizobium sp.]MBU6462583.1 cytochrome c oxidase subunit II [Pseudomonadota bacterium]MDE2067204.1 cytochrome c oxidase subunit II [Bradyrhizobium sp.]MDE2470552.1 cytochrome c oxidase subunit II [Bradyrhizobium sp.]
MYHWIPFWPDTAAVNAVVVNNLYIAELGLSGLIMVTVVAMMLTFCIRYRKAASNSRADLETKTWRFEILWTVATLGAFLILFVWGAQVYIWLYKPPPADEEVYVVGKQWMWKVEHPGGQREIDALHVPVNKVVRLVMASEDVIHSFFVPAFRIKHDVVPGTLETLWFKATKTGIFRLECTQYCGLQHATMQGEIVVMEAPDYANWLDSQGVEESLAQQGAELFRAHGCSGCHGKNSTIIHAPSLTGLYGTVVHLQDGSIRVADEAYLRDCILNPRSFTVAGYPPVMPDFSGQLGEGDLLKLIAYIKSLGGKREAGR